MPSAEFKTLTAATSAREVVLELLEIDQELLQEPIRLVNDNLDFTCAGHLYTACAFRLSWPPDTDGQVPQAQLEIDNVGRELVEPIQATQGLLRATATLRNAIRSQPEIIQREITMDLSGVHVDQQVVSGSMGYDNMLDQPAVMVRHTPSNSPGLF